MAEDTNADDKVSRASNAEVGTTDATNQAEESSPDESTDAGLGFESFTRRGVLGVLATVGLLVGTESASAASDDHLGEEWVGTPSTGYGLKVSAGATEGLFGHSTLTSGTSHGVRGETDSASGYGLYTSGDAKVGNDLEVGGAVDANSAYVQDIYDSDFVRIQVNGNQGRLSVVGGDTGVNVYNGTHVNNIPVDVSGTTISGGGYSDGSDYNPNEIYSDFGTIGGGAGNEIGTSENDSRYSTISGGMNNRTDGNYGVVSGGSSNVAGPSDGSEAWNTVAGGFYNAATGGMGSVGGGYNNTASGYGSTVPGGYSNTASGEFSFAAGRSATADHDNSFVWNDDTYGFGSTGSNQFLVSASNGIGLGTDSPDTPVDIRGQSNWDLSSGDGDVKIGDDTYRLGIGVALGGAGAGTARINAKGGTGELRLGGNGTDVMTIDADTGDDAVRPTSDNTTSLGSSGNRWTAVWAVDGTINTSDARLKTGVTNIDTAVETVQQLEPVSFQWNGAVADEEASEEADEPAGDGTEGDRHFGFLAQDVADVLPEAVENPDGGYLGLRYSELVPVLTRAVQEQQDALAEKDGRIDDLEDELAQRDGRIDDLERRLAAVEEQLVS